MKTEAVAVRVPATTSNLGPGFDTLGLALQLYNVVQVRRRAGRGVEISSPIDQDSRPGAVVMLQAAAAGFFRKTRRPAFGIDVCLSGDVPIARGLGSSVTARLGVVAALDALTGAGLGRQELLGIIAALEQHPDNAAPAIYGGFTICAPMNGEVRILRFPVSPRAKFVVLIPRFEISTKRARRLVPDSFSKSDSVYNLGRVAFISAAFATGRLSAMQSMFGDRIHQPYRERLIPQLSNVLRAGEAAGAIGGWLSGSGSAIICLTMNKAGSIARAMQMELADSDVRILSADNRGYKVVKSSCYR